MKSPSLWGSCSELASRCPRSGSWLLHLVFPRGELLTFRVGCFFIVLDIAGKLTFLAASQLRPVVSALSFRQLQMFPHISTWPCGVGTALRLCSPGPQFPHLTNGPQRFPRARGASHSSTRTAWAGRRATRLPQSSAWIYLICSSSTK